MSTEGIYYEFGTTASPAALNKWEVPELSQHVRLLEKFLQQDPIGSDLIENWEHFVDVHIGAQLSRLKFPVEGSGGSRVIVPSHIVIAKPTYCPDPASEKVRPLWPSMARKLELSYCIRIYAYFSEYHDKEYEEYLLDPSKPIDVLSQSMTATVIAELPCMRRSKYCHTHGLTDEQLNQRGEMRGDPGCYFTIAGKDYFLRMIELCRTNYPLIFDRKANKGGPACSITVDLIESSVVTNVVTGNNDLGVPVVGLTLQGVNRTTDEVKKKSIVTNFLTVIRAIAIIKAVDSMKDASNILAAMMTLTDRKNWRRVHAILASTLLDDTRLTHSDDIMKFLLVQFGEVPKDARPNVQFQDYSNPSERHHRVRELLDAYVIAIPGLTAIDRIYSILFMVTNYVEFKAGIRELTDRDVWMYKRISGPDRAFRISFRKLLNLHYGTNYGILKKYSEFTDVNSINQIWKEQTSEGVCGNGKITLRFIRQFKMSCWGGGNQGTQTLSQLMSVLGDAMSIKTEIMKIYTSIEPKAMVLGPRSHKPSQLAYVGVATPHTRQCGLAKESAITCRVTRNIPQSEVMQALEPYLIVVDDDEILQPVRTAEGIKYTVIDREALDDPRIGRVLVNGIFRGWANAAETRVALVSLRRRGELHKHTSIYLDSFMNMFIHVDEGRVVRPLLILDDQRRLIIDVNNWWNKSVQFLINNGAVEYLDPMEIESYRVAETPDKITEHEVTLQRYRVELDTTKGTIDRISSRLKKLRASNNPSRLIAQFFQESGVDIPEPLPTRDDMIKKYTSQLTDLHDQVQIIKGEIDILTRPENQYTHCEIHPATQLDVAASNIPLMQHSQASKVVGQANMARQATTGETGFTSTYRGSATRIGSYFLTRPLVSTVMERMHGAYSNSLIVMFTTLKGMTIEDAIIINRNSLNRLKTFKTFTVSVVVSGITSKKGSTGNLVLGRPPLNRMETPEQRNRFRWIGKNGLPYINSPLQIGDVMVGITRTTTRTYSGQPEDSSRIVKPGEEGIVHRINVMKVKKAGGREYHKVVNITIRRSSLPIRGDKFTTRNGQKVTIGAIVDPEDMPRTANGAIPDIIYNSHAMKRMTINFIYEMLMGRKALLTGRPIDATAFEESNIEQVVDYLKQAGFTNPGYEKIYIKNKDGELVESEGEVYIGPAAVQQLKHQAAAAFRVRADGPTDPATRQGSKGGDNPALKMNRHDHAAHDRYKKLRELLEDTMKKIDRCPISYCTRCNELGTSTMACDGPTCETCGSADYVAKTNVPFSTIRLKYFMSVAGLALHIGSRRDAKRIEEEEAIDPYESDLEQDNDASDFEEDYQYGEGEPDIDDFATKETDITGELYGEADEQDLEDEIILEVDDDYQLNEGDED